MVADPDDGAARPLTDADGEARSRILAAAFGLFMEKGYTGVSTLEIATRARVSKRDLYALVGNKQEVLRACIATRAQRMSAEGVLSRRPRARPEMEAALTRIGETMLTELLEPAVVAVHRLAIAEAERSPELGAELGRVRDAKRAFIAGLFTDAQRWGLVAAGDASAMAETFLDLLGGPRLILRALSGGVTSTDEIHRLAAQAAAAFVRLNGA
jgi:AcrR family transcriptional regulator